ncbi:MAG: hypothetical protein ACRDGT_11450 [Candidatus Limnocylindria bacterium]
MKKSLAVALAAAIALVAVGAFALANAAPGDVEAGRRTVEAPIDELDVLVRESHPPQVALRLVAGLPSGCAEPHSHSVTRTGDTITVKVLNSLPTGDPICTMIYGTYDLTVELGSDFVAGTTYTVQVNDRTTTFTLR